MALNCSVTAPQCPTLVEDARLLDRCLSFVYILFCVLGIRQSVPVTCVALGLHPRKIVFAHMATDAFTCTCIHMQLVSFGVQGCTVNTSSGFRDADSVQHHIVQCNKAACNRTSPHSTSCPCFSHSSRSLTIYLLSAAALPLR